jgi:hypothetical protein
MRAGREAQLARQHEEHASAKTKFMSWIREEARLFTSRNATIYHCGRDSDEFREIDAQWRELLKSRPTPPPDHAWAA